MLKKELAALLGVSPAMVSKLVKQGMPTDNLERAQRWRRRHLEPSRVKGVRLDEYALPPADPNAPTFQGEDRAAASTRREVAQADLAEMERDQLRAKLIEREQVETALDELVIFARQGLENMPHQVASMLAGKDYEQIVAILKQHLIELMGKMHQEAGQRLAELTTV